MGRFRCSLRLVSDVTSDSEHQAREDFAELLVTGRLFNRDYDKNNIQIKRVNLHQEICYPILGSWDRKYPHPLGSEGLPFVESLICAIRGRCQVYRHSETNIFLVRCKPHDTYFLDYLRGSTRPHFMCPEKHIIEAKPVLFGKKPNGPPQEAPQFPWVIR